MRKEGFRVETTPTRRADDIGIVAGNRWMQVAGYQSSGALCSAVCFPADDADTKFRLSSSNILV